MLGVSGTYIVRARSLFCKSSRFGEGEGLGVWAYDLGQRTATGGLWS